MIHGDEMPRISHWLLRLSKKCTNNSQVSYSTKGWIDKNNDSLVPEIESLLADGSKELVTSMADTSRLSAAYTGERLCSVSSTYLSNLNDSRTELETV